MDEHKRQELEQLLQGLRSFLGTPTADGLTAFAASLQPFITQASPKADPVFTIPESALTSNQLAFFKGLAQLSAKHNVSLIDRQAAYFRDESDTNCLFTIETPGQISLRFSVTIASGESGQADLLRPDSVPQSASSVQASGTGRSCSTQSSPGQCGTSSAPQGARCDGQDQTLGFPPLSMGSVLESAPSKAEEINPTAHLCYRCLEHVFLSVPGANPDHVCCPLCLQTASVRDLEVRQREALGKRLKGIEQGLSSLTEPRVFPDRRQLPPE